jgi:hypothetical protein
MTTINTNYMTQQQLMGGTPFGNTRNLPFNFTTSSSGVIVNGDLTTAIQIGDVVRLGILPKGLSMQDVLVIISDAFTAATTASIGFLYTDGVDVTAAPQDAAYFASALSTASTGVSRKTGVKAPVTLPKDAYLTLTIGGAAHASVGVMDVIAIGIDTGGN